jgi:hypothetical protein
MEFPVPSTSSTNQEWDGDTSERKRSPENFTDINGPSPSETFAVATR